MRFIKCILLLVLATNYALAQQSDLNSISNQHDSLQVKYYFNRGEEYKANKPDSAIYFFEKALEITERNSDEKRYKWYKWNIFKGLGVAYLYKSDFSKSIDCYQKQISVALLIDDSDGIIKGYNNIGVVYENLGKYVDAFTYYLKALRIAEKNNDYYMLGMINNNISAIYLIQSDYDKTIEYGKKSIKYYNINHDTISAANAYSNIGAAYMGPNGNVDSALYYINLAEKTFQNTNNLYYLSTITQNKGAIYEMKKQYKEALKYFEKAYDLCQQLGSYLNIANILHIEASTYIKMYREGDKNPQYVEIAERKNLEALNIIDNIDKDIDKSSILANMYTIDSIRGNFKSAFFNLYKYLEFDLQHRGLSNNVSVVQLENRFLMDKKQQEVDMLEEKNALVSEQARLMRIITIISIFSIVILIVSVFLIIRRLKITQHQKLIIQDQNNKLFEQNEEITTQKEEIEKQRKSMVDSITYAKRIQQAVLPKLPSSDNLEHFILFQPKDIVSGDFYWFNRSGNKLYFTISDCTGHGVPGGFMSMLGVSFLNEIMTSNHSLDAGQILDELRQLVISALQQNGNMGDTKDGMDMAFCILDTSTNVLQYAGAYNSLYLISAESNELQTIKGDRQPIAYFNKMKPFTNHQIQLHKGDCLYLSSDGYKDQFDADGNKFGAKRFDNLLTSISGKSMYQQKVELEQVLRVWIQNSVQIDDVTVLGIRI